MAFGRSRGPSHRVEITSTLKFSRDRRCRDPHDRDFSPTQKLHFQQQHIQNLFSLSD